MRHVIVGVFSEIVKSCREVNLVMAVSGVWRCGDAALEIRKRKKKFNKF